MKPQVDGEGLDDRARDDECARVGAYYDTDETHTFADDDAEEGDEAVDDGAGVEGS